MADAALAAVRAGFAVLDLDVIEAGVQPENEASLRVLHRLGMRPIGERVIFASARNREELCHYYGISRHDFVGRGAN